MSKAQDKRAAYECLPHSPLPDKWATHRRSSPRNEPVAVKFVTGWIDDTTKGTRIEFWSCRGSRWCNLWQQEVIPAVSWGVGTGLGDRLWRKVKNCGWRKSTAKTVRSEHERSLDHYGAIMAIFCLEAPAWWNQKFGGEMWQINVTFRI